MDGMATEASVQVTYTNETLTDYKRTGSEGWHSGICQCCDDGHSCCVLFGYNYEIISRGECDCVAGGLFYTLLLPLGLHWMLGASARSNLRKMLKLNGSVCCDRALHFCCHCCALAQEYKELTMRGYVVEAGWNNNRDRIAAKEKARLEQQKAVATTQPAVQTQMSRNPRQIPSHES